MDRNDFRQILKSEFERRKGRNSFYSLRAYARDLGISPARLSEVLSAKKGLSPKAATAIARKLGLPSHEQKIFALSVAALHSRSSIDKNSAREKLEREKERLLEEPPRHSTLVHWTTEATLKLSDREDFQANPGYLSRVLGLPPYMGFGLGYLARAGLLPGSNLEKAYLRHRLQGKRINVDFEQILELARKAFLLAKGECNFFEHEPLLIEPEDIPAARKIIMRTFKDLKNLQSNNRNAKLFYFSTHFFKIEQEGRIK